ETGSITQYEVIKPASPDLSLGSRSTRRVLPATGAFQNPERLNGSALFLGIRQETRHRRLAYRAASLGHLAPIGGLFHGSALDRPLLAALDTITFEVHWNSSCFSLDNIRHPVSYLLFIYHLWHSCN